MPPNTVVVSRPSRWGNPFWVSKWRSAADCVALFEMAMQGVWDPKVSEHIAATAPAWTGYDEYQQWMRTRGDHPLHAVLELRGKNLACWCKPGDPCHADVLLRLANSPSAVSGGTDNG